MTPAGRMSATSNPLSAITLSPSSKRSRTPHFLVISLSDTLPDHSLDTKSNTAQLEKFLVMPSKCCDVCIQTRFAIGNLEKMEFQTGTAEHNFDWGGLKSNEKTLRGSGGKAPRKIFLTTPSTLAINATNALFVPGNARKKY